MKKFWSTYGAVSLGILVTALCWAVRAPVLPALLGGILAGGVVWFLATTVEDDSEERDSSEIPGLEGLLTRALASVESIDEMTINVKDVDGSAVREQAHLVLEGFEKSMSAIRMIDKSVERINPARLLQDERNLEEEISRSSVEVRNELRPVLTALQEQNKTLTRLQDMRSKHVRNLNSSVVSLDLIVSQIAELEVVTSASGKLDFAAKRLSQASESLEALRKGFEETDRVTKNILDF